MSTYPEPVGVDGMESAKQILREWPSNFPFGEDGWSVMAAIALFAERISPKLITTSLPPSLTLEIFCTGP